jgi:regulator of sirC expression with transglutaminase-like and TPR domain
MTFLDALNLLAKDPAAPLDVAETALLFATDEYPDLDSEHYLRIIDQLALEAAPRMTGDLENRVAGLASLLFDDQGFQGNGGDYYDPRNSYLNDVLERRLGIPISLTVLAMAVGERAGLEIAGVGLPGHFIAKAVDGIEQVLFDPFHGGQLLTPGACGALVEAVTGGPFTLTPEALQPLPLGLIVMRMLNNLKGIYLKREDFPRAVRVIEHLRVLAPDDPTQRRDLGVALVRAGRSGPAIDHLSAYLARFPDGADAQLVKDVLQQAKKEVSRWN